MGDLTEDEKSSVRDMILSNGYGSMLGIGLFDDQSEFSLGMGWNMNLESDGKTAFSVTTHYPEIEDPKGKHEYTQQQFDDFNKNELPKHEVKKHQINDLCIRMTPTIGVPSWRRVKAVGKLMGRLEERMRLQAKAYDDKQALLVNAFGGSGDIAPGMSANTLSDNDRFMLASGLVARGSAKDENAAKSFLDRAKVDKTWPYIGIGMRMAVGANRHGGVWGMVKFSR